MLSAGAYWKLYGASQLSRANSDVSQQLMLIFLHSEHPVYFLTHAKVGETYQLNIVELCLAGEVREATTVRT
jgi:hypothetical protein